MFCNSTITDLFLFVFTQLILHYRIILLLDQKEYDVTNHLTELVDELAKLKSR